MAYILRHTFVLLLALTSVTATAEPVELSAETYKPDLGILILRVNWGRVWGCGNAENGQLQVLNFTKTPIDSQDATALDLETPSRLNVFNKFLGYAYVIQPGQYFLTGYDLKIAYSVRDIVHKRGTKNILIRDGVPFGGTFTVNPGEIVYIGDFGVDCTTAEPSLWRYSIMADDFDRYVEGFRESYPFVKQVPVHYRIFETRFFGNQIANETESITIN
jgi:hypothetical protein